MVLEVAVTLGTFVFLVWP